MGLAFWRRKKGAADAAPRRNVRSAGPGEDESGGRADDAAALRIRARRRLIGAAALLLAAVIVVPMLLDPEPRPVPDSIPIEIPSEKTPFTPRLSLPPVPAPENVPMPPADTAPEEPAKDESKAARPTDEKKADEKKAEEQRARALLEGKSDAKALPAVAKGGRFAVQAAAPSSEAAAIELVGRLKKAGFAPYTETIESKDGTRHRVRVGPYATRDDAERARSRLKTLGINANLVTL
jgi:DedD protein